jgi:hypothetical protein
MGPDLAFTGFGRDAIHSWMDTSEMDTSDFAAFAAAIFDTLADAAKHAGHPRLALGLRLTAHAVRWGLPLLM